MKNNYFHLILVLVFVLFSCQKENIENTAIIDYGHEYFNLKENTELVYEVTEINIDDPSGVYDTVNYFLKYVFKEPFVDDGGRDAMKLYIYKSDVCNDSSWGVPNVYWCAITDREAIAYEENIPIVKLVFPVEEGKIWDANKYNDLEKKECMMQLLSNNRLKVIQEDNITLISEDVEFEIYARNIGLVEKEIKHLEAYYSDLSVPIEERLKVGYIFRMKLVDCE